MIFLSSTCKLAVLNVTVLPLNCSCFVCLLGLGAVNIEHYDEVGNMPFSVSQPQGREIYLISAVSRTNPCSLTLWVEVIKYPSLCHRVYSYRFNLACESLSLSVLVVMDLKSCL